MLTTSRFAFAHALALGLAPLYAGAQYDYPAKQPEPAKEQVSASGVVKGLAPGVMYIQADDGGKWAVAVEPNAREISYSNSAAAGWLRSGLWIEFNARISAKGEVVAPISAVNVLTPTEKNPPGIFSEVSGAKGPELFSDGKEEQPKKPPQRKGDEVGDFRVLGQIGGVKDGKVQISAGGTLLKVEFTEDAKVGVEVKGVELARPGDQVEFRGWYYQGAKGKALANYVSVTGKEPLKPEPTKRRPGQKPPAEKGEKMEEGKEKTAEKEAAKE